MKKVIFILVLLIGGATLVFLSFNGNAPKRDLSFAAQDFKVEVAREEEEIKTTFESGGSGITFGIKAKDAKVVEAQGKAIYEISPDTKIEYETLSGGDSRGIKEIITLNNRNAPNEYSFSLSLKDITDFRPNPEKKSWHFYGNGKEAFYIPASFMVDAKGERSEEVTIGITRNDNDYTLTVTADQEWLSDPARTYPVRIDPSVVVSTGIVEADAQFGSIQRKVTYAASNWYVFYTDAGDAWYKKSSDGSTWGSAVEVDTEATDTDNYNPTVWLEGSLIYVAWVDDSKDAVEVNTINTASSDALGTKCTSSDQGTIDSTITTSVAVADNGTVYASFSDTSAATNFAILELTFSGCTFAIASSKIAPTDVIVGWPSTAASIPTGWTRDTTLDTKYLKGVPTAATNPGTAGGATTHSHTTSAHSHTLNHSHTSNPNTGAADNDDTAVDVETGAQDLGGTNHVHTIPSITGPATINSGTASPTSDAQNNDPANLVAIWIKSDASTVGIPTSAVAFFNSASLPTNWSQNTNGKDAFLKGAAAAGDGGGTGGAATHTHAGGSHSHTASHTHTAVTSGASATKLENTDAGTGAMRDTHTHSVSVASATPGTPSSTTISMASSNHEPPFYKEAIIQNDGSGDLPDNIIAVWTGTIANIPQGWVIADGTNSTPNLLGQYIKGANLTSEIGNTGGATSHTHTGSNHSAHTWASHSHSSAAASASTPAASSGGAGTNAADSPHGHTAVNSAANSAITTGTAAPDGASSSSEPQFTEVAYIMWQGVGGASQVLVTIGNNLHVIYQDTNLSHSVFNGSSWTTVDTTIASVTDTTFSVTTDDTNLWVLSVSGTTATNFYTYNGTSWSSLTAPWTGQTNLTAVSISYVSADTDLYAAVIKDTSEQAYWLSSDSTNINWIHEHSFNFTAGDLGHVSMPISATSAYIIQALLRQGSNLEFSGTDTGPAFKRIDFRGGTELRGGSTFQ